MTAINHGPCPADDVVLSAILPAGFGLINVPSPCAASAQGVGCQLGHLAPKEASLRGFIVSVPCDYAVGPTTSIDVVSSATCDPMPGNNVTSRPTQVTACLLVPPATVPTLAPAALALIALLLPALAVARLRRRAGSRRG